MNTPAKLIAIVGLSLVTAAAAVGQTPPDQPALQPASPADSPNAVADAEALVAQTALLEATRQDMVTYRLNQLAARFDDLVRDLRSNGIDDANLNDDLSQLADRIETLQQRHVQKVRADLASVADRGAQSAETILAIQGEMRRIVRELAVLLLEAGVQHATDVAATRLDDITDTQVRLMDSTPGVQDAAPSQRALANELEELLAELRSLVAPMANPLAAVRLSRVRKSIEEAEVAGAMRSAADALEAGNRETAREHQARTLEALRAAREKLREKEQGDHRRDLRSRRLAAERGMDKLRVHQDRVLDFISRIEDVQRDDEAFARHMDDLRRQLEELEAMAAELPETDKWTPAVRTPMRGAALRIRAALEGFENGDRESAMRESRSVIGSLRVAADRLERKATVLENIESHLELAEDMTYVSGFLGDVEAEQKDIGEQEPTAKQGKRDQRVVAGAVGELRETVDGVSEASSVSEPMQEAESVMSDLVRLEPEQVDVPALRTQAEERVGTAKQRATAVAARAEYVAEWLEYLGRQQADLLSLLARQVELRERTEREAERMFGELRGEQDLLLGETEVYAGNMEIGQEHYVVAAKEMRLAIEQLDAVDRDRAVFHEKLAEEALRAAAKALADMMGRIAELTTLEKMPAYEAEVHILSKVLMLAVEQRHIRYRTRKATVEEMRKFTAREQEHLRRVTLSITTDERAAALGDLIEGLNDAADVMGQAVTSLNDADRETALKRQLKAEKILRMFIAELSAQLLEVMEQVFPEAEGGGGDSWMVNAAMPMEAVRIFGEAPVAPHQGTQIGPSTWEPLNARERSALSENFARELPLEYRTMLKAYYRSLAE